MSAAKTHSSLGVDEPPGEETIVPKCATPCIDDFEIIKPISRGAYAKVYLGYKKPNPTKLYAIKVC